MEVVDFGVLTVFFLTRMNVVFVNGGRLVGIAWRPFVSCFSDSDCQRLRMAYDLDLYLTRDSFDG